MIIYYINNTFKLKKTIQNILIIIFTFYIFLLSLSRIILGAHFLNQIIIGILLGALNYYIFIIIYESNFIEKFFNINKYYIIYEENNF